MWYQMCEQMPMVPGLSKEACGTRCVSNDAYGTRCE